MHSSGSATPLHSRPFGGGSFPVAFAINVVVASGSVAGEPAVVPLKAAVVIVDIPLVDAIVATVEALRVLVVVVAVAAAVVLLVDVVVAVVVVETRVGFVVVVVSVATVVVVAVAVVTVLVFVVVVVIVCVVTVLVVDVLVDAGHTVVVGGLAVSARFWLRGGVLR